MGGSAKFFYRFYVVFAIFYFQIESLLTCQRENNKEIDGVEKLDEYVAEQNSTKSGNAVPYHNTATESKQQKNTSISFSNVKVIQNYLKHQEILSTSYLKYIYTFATFSL